MQTKASNDFERILVKDDRIGCITDKIKYGVLTGGQNITSQSFNAISASNSAHVFNIAVPSLETIISREALWTCDLTLRIECNNFTSMTPMPTVTTAGKPNIQGSGSFGSMFAVNYGVTDALGPMPLHQLVSTMTATINNNSVSMNVQDVLPALLRMCDAEDLEVYDCTTPTTLDYLANYRDSVDTMQYQILSSNQGNVSRPIVCGVGIPTEAGAIGSATAYAGRATQKFISYPSNVLAYDMSRQASSKFKKPRGCFVINRIYNAAGVTPVLADSIVYIDVKITEPLLLSPFIFGSPENKQGFYGITNMNFQMNLAANANRAWRSVKFNNTIAPGGIYNWLTKSAYIEKFTSSTLTFTFLTGHPTDELPSRNIVPYYELPVYKTSGPKTIAGRTTLNVDATGKFAKPISEVITSNNLQLNMIPDKLIIFCRRSLSSMDTSYSDSFLTITGVNINFNNNAGLLSSMTQEQLYKASVQSGLKNMSWPEFSGITTCVADAFLSNQNSEPASGLGGVGAYQILDVGGVNTLSTPGFQLVPTVGSMVILNFAEVIQLTESYYAPGSMGQFNLQVSVSVQNNQVEDFTAGQWEMVIIPMNAGIFVNERGTSSVYTALLTKADVLDASEQEHYSHGTIKRMVGGSMLSNLKSAMGWLSSKLPFVKNALGKINHPYAKVGHDVLQSMGYGRSGGGASGGGLASRLTN